MTRIKEATFNGCSSLIRVAIPSSVTNIEERAFNWCSVLTSVAIPASITSIGLNAFARCSSLTTVLVQPGDTDDDATAVANADDTNSAVWSTLFAPWDNEDYDSDDSDDEEQHEQHFSDDVKIWAPDTVVAQLTGYFEGFNRFAEVLRACRAAPDAKTWAAVQLWLWWLPPTSFSDSVGGDASLQVVCKSRVAAVWTTMLAGLRTEKVATLPLLPEELWLLVFGFLKHDQQPTFATEESL